ncbi:hypothetical protein ACWD1W_01740 [Streptomyces olivaceoviridis]
MTRRRAVHPYDDHAAHNVSSHTSVPLALGERGRQWVGYGDAGPGGLAV